MTTNYSCTKCDHKVYSKCIHQRFVFNRDDTVITNILKFKDVPKGEPNVMGGIPYIKLMYLCPVGDTPDKRLTDVFKTIRSMTDREVELYCCQHEFKVDPGEECMFGCCIGEEIEKEVVNVS